MNPSEQEKLEVAEMFDGVAETGDLGGIMANGDYNEYEIDKLKDAFLRRLVFQEKHTLLDGGIGIGRLVPLYKAVGFGSITGIDISEKMLVKCAESYPDVELHKADLCDIALFPENRFDVTMLVYTLIHITEDSELDRAIAEVERVTKNEVVIVQVMEPERLGVHGGHCKVREVYDLIKRFKTKGAYRFLKNYHEIKASDGAWVNKVSVLVMR